MGTGTVTCERADGITCDAQDNFDGECIDINVNKVTGAYHYYIKTSPATGLYGKNAMGRICFEPAQLETINSDDLFCFTNTQEALNMFHIKNIDNDCAEYWGGAQVEITNLSENGAVRSKADPCAEDSSCRFSEAELVRVIKLDEDTPFCNK
ncbi:MAG: hypothetical protein ACOZBH_02160 [Patescibacteria group bacterium]